MTREMIIKFTIRYFLRLWLLLTRLNILVHKKTHDIVLSLSSNFILLFFKGTCLQAFMIEQAFHISFLEKLDKLARIGYIQLFMLQLEQFCFQFTKKIINSFNLQLIILINQSCLEIKPNPVSKEYIDLTCF